MELAQLIMFNLLLTYNNAFLVEDDPSAFKRQLDYEYVEELHCLILNTYHEARGEDFDAKVAVAQSVINRVRDDTGEFKRHSTVCGVVYRADRDETGAPIMYRCWYSWYCDGKPDDVRLYTASGTINKLEKQAWKDSILASFYAYHDLYPSLIGSATHYYNYHMVYPEWANHYTVIGDVGQHRFLK